MTAAQAAQLRVVTAAGVRLHVLDFEPRNLGIAGTQSTGYAPKLSGSQALGRASTIGEVAAVLDGPMFVDGGNAGGRARFRLLDRAAGLDVPSRELFAGLTFSVVNGAVSVAEGAIVPDGASVAVQVYPTLVKQGRVAATSNTTSNNSRVWRAALVLFASGRLAFVVGVGTMLAFATALRDAGAIHAGYTDGGSSTDLRTATTRWGFTGSPRVPFWLVARGRFEGSNGAIGSSIKPLLTLGALAGLAFIATSRG